MKKLVFLVCLLFSFVNCNSISVEKEILKQSNLGIISWSLLSKEEQEEIRAIINDKEQLKKDEIVWNLVYQDNKDMWVNGKPIEAKNPKSWWICIGEKERKKYREQAFKKDVQKQFNLFSDFYVTESMMEYAKDTELVIKDEPIRAFMHNIAIILEKKKKCNDNQLYDSTIEWWTTLSVQERENRRKQYEEILKIDDFLAEYGFSIEDFYEIDENERDSFLDFLKNIQCDEIYWTRCSVSRDWWVRQTEKQRDRMRKSVQNEDRLNKIAEEHLTYVSTLTKNTKLFQNIYSGKYTCSLPNVEGPFRVSYYTFECTDDTLIKDYKSCNNYKILIKNPTMKMLLNEVSGNNNKWNSKVVFGVIITCANMEGAPSFSEMIQATEKNYNIKLSQKEEGVYSGLNDSVLITLELPDLKERKKFDQKLYDAISKYGNGLLEADLESTEKIAQVLMSADEIAKIKESAITQKCKELDDVLRDQFIWKKNISYRNVMNSDAYKECLRNYICGKGFNMNEGNQEPQKYQGDLQEFRTALKEVQTGQKEIYEMQGIGKFKTLDEVNARELSALVARDLTLNLTKNENVSAIFRFIKNEKQNLWKMEVVDCKGADTYKKIKKQKEQRKEAEDDIENRKKEAEKQKNLSF